jgi:hypothetical protein
MTVTLNSKRGWPTICADAIFCCLPGAVGENLFGLAVLPISIEGKSEFSRRPIHHKNNGDKKAKTKSGAAGWLFFFEAKKRKPLGYPRQILLKFIYAKYTSQSQPTRSESRSVGVLPTLRCNRAHLNRVLA